MACPMKDDPMEESMEQEEYLQLDQLPYVCLWHICSFLPPESLAQLSGVNQMFKDVCSSEQLWREHCLCRWQFCNISQVSEGPQRWQRYFRARRKVEARMDTGRPTKDYRVKSLRGHSADIINVICVNDHTDNLQNPTPPLVISLSSDMVVYAWDVKEGKPVWSLENVPVTCITGNNDTVIVGDSTGHVTLYRTSDWSELTKFPPSDPERSVTCLEVVSTLINKIKYNILMVCSISNDASSGEISLIDLSQNKPLVTLTTNSLCSMMAIKGVWLAAAQETSASEVYIWNLSNVFDGHESPNTPISPHVTLHLSNNCSRPLIWLKPGVIATCSTGLHAGSLFPHVLPINPPIPPGQVHIMQRRLPGPVPVAMPLFQSTPSSNLETWDVAKHMEEAKKATSYVFNVKHMYDCLSSVTMACIPQSLAYSNGKLVAGEPSGCVKVIDFSNGQCLQTFNDHKAAVTDIYADSYRLLTCSKDFSIRVYRWIKDSGAAKPSYKLDSRYQLLGGSVALKTHDGFNCVLGQSGSCVGVAGNILKLYTFIHQLE